MLRTKPIREMSDEQLKHYGIFVGLCVLSGKGSEAERQEVSDDMNAVTDEMRRRMEAVTGKDSHEQSQS